MRFVKDLVRGIHGVRGTKGVFIERMSGRYEGPFIDDFVAQLMGVTHTVWTRDNPIDVWDGILGLTPVFGADSREPIFE
jgi:hypothetical protein